MRELTASATRLARARSQLLLDPREALRTLGVARRVAGLNAQRRGIDGLAIRARASGLRETDVERARVDDRSVVRAWFMRFTLHLVPAEDAGWLLGLLGPAFVASDMRRRKQLGLADDLTERGARVIVRELADRGPLTRAEIGQAIGREGLPIDFSGQALVHLIALVSLRGLVCSGPYRDGKETHVLLRDWAEIGRPRERADALGELARRYLHAFAPAAPEDFSRWSGLPRGDAREAWRSIAGELTEVRVAGQSAWLLTRDVPALLDAATSAGAPSVRLLPAFDDYLLGWRSRDLVVDSAHARRLTPGGGILHPTVVADGRAVATWRLRSDGTVELAAFEPLPEAIPPALEAEVADLGRFLGRSLRLA